VRFINSSGPEWLKVPVETWEDEKHTKMMKATMYELHYPSHVAFNPENVLYNFTLAPFSQL